MLSDEETDAEKMNEEKTHILKFDIEVAIKTLKTRKSQDENGITAEALKEMGEMGIEIMFKIYNEIWNIGKWSYDWCKLIFISIYKKRSQTDATVR